MNRRTYFLVLILAVLPVSSPCALASYYMSCELNGEVVSIPLRSEIIEFEFAVRSARDLEPELLRGEPDCHLLRGKRIKVVMDYEDAGDEKQIVNGKRLRLERYDLDLVDEKTGRVFRSVKYSRKDK